MTLEELTKRRDELLEEVRSPDFNKDIRENDNRAVVIEELQTINYLIETYNKGGQDIDNVGLPGVLTLNGNIFNITWYEAVQYNRELALPCTHKAKLVPKYGHIDLNNTDEVIGIPIDSCIGRAIQGKMPGLYTVFTAHGYVKIGVKWQL
jgi:hypothetical protein